MKTRLLFLTLMICALIFSCQQKGSDSVAVEEFDVSLSEPAAVQLADSVIESSGGLQAWNTVRTVTWTNNDLTLSWDKHKHLVRIESPADNATYLFNLKTNEGKVSENGTEIKDAIAVEEKLKTARKTFAKESFQLFAPFNLKNKGVMLTYEGEDSLKSEKCNVLQATFSPDHPLHPSKYLAYIDLKENLIRQLAYFSSQSQDSADVIMNTDSYEKLGVISLPISRALEKGPQDIKLDEEFPSKFFSDL